MNKEEENKLYYIWEGSYIGDAMLWWGKNRCGYTADLDKAGKYTKEEAEEITNCRDSDSAFLCSRIDKSVAVIKIVDAQYINKSKPDIKTKWNHEK